MLEEVRSNTTAFFNCVSVMEHVRFVECRTRSGRRFVFFAFALAPENERTSMLEEVRSKTTACFNCFSVMGMDGRVQRPRPELGVGMAG